MWSWSLIIVMVMAVPVVIGQRLQNGACLNRPLTKWPRVQVTKDPNDQVTKGRERFCWKPKCQICGLPLLVASVNSHLSPQTLTLMGWWVTSCLCQTFQPGGVNFLLSWRSQPQPQMLNGDFREAFLFQNAWFFWLLERGAVGHLKN